MPQQYNAFLVRHWTLDDEQGERAELTHLQSGERTRVASLAEALTWMRAHAARAAPPPPAVVPAQSAEGEGSG